MKSDIWSFGIVLWEIFSSGSIPYPGLSNEEVARKVIDGQVMETPSMCPSKVAELMKHCWSYNPDERPTFVELEQSFGLLCNQANMEGRKREAEGSNYNLVLQDWYQT